MLTLAVAIIVNIFQELLTVTQAQDVKQNLH